MFMLMITSIWAMSWHECRRENGVWRGGGGGGHLVVLSREQRDRNSSTDFADTTSSVRLLFQSETVLMAAIPLFGH